ncbi:hypothetical protein A2524_01590 [Candidatus Wolfebacteria bacterium RIFOXYD12_FULL_48_21]|uniref:Uncharacterized protein n=1 Tax=Candidatus Wolfebacteria bacterium RIFOXYD1_FULL_48_65 TaxID=1802561 RepID=A0A1F8E178_9BACT|nr:MAG: hypothetical protein A2610_03565 [Candidatus Wolfebacteria bacterium RIFOXYD1_FULL_48_65]OGM94493.1 MAG: hypothetical protein A2524_01590 [Candidatus Wolfebacteria bacterium RIFOXYD12_FULL_48_21]OGM96679.1 MAG: hypothetical protein A2532_03940 [Candidatus Wolfebacteria bacterium RIFOXYD2_FULL_48_11]
MTRWQKLEVFLELLIFGIVIGIIEDLIAIKFATGEPITWGVVGIVVLVAIPFAILGEVVLDRIDFASILQRMFEKKKPEDDTMQ